MPVLNAREVATQKACALFYVALRHAFLQPKIADCLADIHVEWLGLTEWYQGGDRIVTRVDVSGKRKISKYFSYRLLSFSWVS